ncbi:very long chain fatty acid elongase AAEL008004-like [Culicoides brevitarsis]|uniref:very long chain fatty acid elongase AAEL008004-like n=1 Tax=Culicoides brevitarsis TaxID=469753 RepID=UPI00307BBE81
MMEVYRNWEHYVFVELADPRLNSWPFMRTPWKVFALVGFYYLFVRYLGPRLMKNRKPFKLQKILIIYNAMQVLINFVLVLPGFYMYATGRYSLFCEPINRSRSPEAMMIVHAVYWFFLSKVVELLDTIFFVLRKKDNQITFLHVGHHSAMVLLTWCGIKYFPGGHFTFGGALNAFVHVIMYTYYMVAAMGPKYQKYLWWKKYITKIQLTQFLIQIIHFSQIFIFDCGFPQWVALIALPNGLFLVDMFCEFYKKAYIEKEKAKNNKIH